MKTGIIHRPDPQAMTQALTAHPHDMVGTVLRLAWLAGLSRGELLALTWRHVHFLQQILIVGNRRVPLSPDLYTYLITLEAAAPPQWELVVLGDGKKRRPPAAQVVSRKVRDALDAVGQQDVRLVDLRHDYILNQLATCHWQTVSRHAGITVQTIQTHFAPYLEQTLHDHTALTPIDPLRLQQVLDAQGDAPQGIALRLAWHLGMARQEMVTLRWGDLDLKRGFLTQNGQKTPLEPELLRFFKTLMPQAPDALVLRGPRSGTALLPDRVSRLCRGALVQGGLDGCSLQTLRQAHALRQGGEEAVLSFVYDHGHITVAQTATLLNLEEKTAYGRLKQWTHHGKLTQVGRRYYLPHTVVAPREQPQAVVAYLQENGIAYRKELAQALGISPQQCSLLLKKLVQQGEIRVENQRYSI